MEPNNIKEKFTRAYSRLSALRQNTPSHYVDEELVREYHRTLQDLGDLEFDVEEFKIPDAWLQRRLTGRSHDGTARYTKDRQVDTEKFLYKLEAVLTCFTPRKEKKKVGFAGRGK